MLASGANQSLTVAGNERIFTDAAILIETNHIRLPTRLPLSTEATYCYRGPRFSLGVR